MKQINYIFAFLLALFCGTNAAKADVVQNYKMDFNTPVTTSVHDFKVAPGWGHYVDSFTDDDDWGYGDTYYVSYIYGSNTGRDGSGALLVSNQTIYGSGMSSRTCNDMIVTPKITGTSSIYVKASNDRSGSIKFYAMQQSNGNWRIGREITLSESPTLSTTDWVKVEIPSQEGTYIGIRGNYVYLDDFEAAEADVELAKSLKITKVTYTGKSDVDCNAEGKFTINYTASITNTGEVTLTPGMENYSLSVVNYSHDNAVVCTQPIEATLEPGASTTVDIAAEVDGNTYPTRNRYDVKENLTNTSTYGTWINPIAYKPAMKVRQGTSSVDAGESFAYGMVTEPVTKEFSVENSGAAPLTLTAIEVPQGFSQSMTLPATIAPHEKADFSVTLNTDVPGIFSGNVTLKGNDVDDFAFAVNGTVLDASKYFENFEGGKIPAGMILESSWSIGQRDIASSGNAYMAVNGSRNGDTKLITPLLKVTEGEKMSFDAARTNYYTTGDDVFLKVYYSTDRQNWTLAKTITGDELSSERAVSYTYYMGKLKTFVVDNIPAGNYYIGFGAGYTCVDNIYGFEKVDVAHDLLVTDKNIPTTGTVNHKFEATVTLKNLNTADEAAGSYSMTLYAGDEAVATAEAGKFAAETDSTFTFAYTPHAAGTVKMYVEFKNLTDGYTLKSAETEVVIAEEKAVSQLVVGTQDETQSNVVFYWNYADNTKGGLCDFYYPAEMLTKYGLKAGDKVAGVSYTGKPTTSKTVNIVEVTASYGLVDPSTYKAGEGIDDLTKVEVMKDVELTISTTEDLTTDINFAEPLEWDGTSAIRFYTYAKGKTSRDYFNVNYPADKDYSTSFYKSGTAQDWSSKTTPVATFAIQKEPSTISGTVKCGDAAIADATVTLKSDDDVIYSGTTDAEGAFSFPVIQTDKTYTLTATAEGYIDYTEENVSMASNLEKNITLKKKAVAVSGKVLFRKAALAGAEVILSHKQGTTKVDLQEVTKEDGTFTFAEVTPGEKYSVEVYMDKFNDYASADSVEITGDTVLDDITLTKPAFKIYGQLKWGDTPVEGVLVQYAYTNADGETWKQAAYSDAEGKYSFTGLDANYVYTLRVIDLNKEFEDQTEGVAVESGEDTEENFSLTIKPVTLTVAADGYMTYSYKRALDFSSVPALKVYAVTDVKKNYTELEQLTTVPANTGVLIDAAAGTYELTPVETAAAVEKNLLVATPADYTISAENVGKQWALTDNNGMSVFKSVAGTTVAKGGAYLDYESTESIIYLSLTDGIRAVDSVSGDAALDLTKPMYNLAGQQVGKDYKGVVIQNGRKFRR